MAILNKLLFVIFLKIKLLYVVFFSFFLSDLWLLVENRMFSRWPSYRKGKRKFH